MTSTLGWQWTFYFVAIFGAALFPLVVLFVPETAYRRDESLATDRATVRNYGSDEIGKEMVEQPSASSSMHKAPGTAETTTPAINNSSSKLISRQALMPFSGRKTDESFLQLLLRPFPLFFHPGIFWAMLIQGTMMGWTVLIGIVLAAIMLGPPLWFDEVKTGYMYTGAFIGALLGFVLAGVLSDSSAKYMTKLNRGIYEPEFRLVLVISQLIFGCAGLYGFGITANDTFR